MFCGYTQCDDYVLSMYPKVVEMLTECCPSDPQFSAAQHSHAQAVDEPYFYFENVDGEEIWSLVIIMHVFMIQAHRNLRQECPDLCCPGQLEYSKEILSRRRKGKIGE